MARQGSQMSKYVKKRRAPPAEETWGNQGSVESFSGEEVDGPNNRRFVLYLEWLSFGNDESPGGEGKFGERGEAVWSSG